MDSRRRAISFAGLSMGLALPAFAQDIQERTIRFGHLNNADHPVSFGVKRFGELVAAKSGGKMKVQEYPASTLGNEMQQQSALQGGVQEMSAPATTSLAGIVKEFGLVDFPVRCARASRTGRRAPRWSARPDADLQAARRKGFRPALGYRGSCWLSQGNVTNSKHADRQARGPRRAEDLRVIPNRVFPDTFMPGKPGADAVRRAVRRARVKGGRRPGDLFAVILSNKFYEVQKFVSATNHVYAANIVLVSKRFWDKLSPAEQKIMNDAANEARGYQRQVSRAAAQKAVGELQAKGMQYNEVAPAEQARMRQVAKPVTDKFPRHLRSGDRQAVFRRARSYSQGLTRSRGVRQTN